MATIDKRRTPAGGVAYRARVRLKGHPPQAATFPARAQARAWAASVEAAIRERRHFPAAEATRRTVAELIDRYAATVLPEKRPGSVRVQAQHLRHWREVLGSYVLADLTPALLVEHRDRLRSEVLASGERRSGSTVNRYLATLRHALGVACREWRWLDANPFARVGMLREPRGRLPMLTDDERARLLAACRTSTNPMLYPFVVLSLSTGARVGELIGLKWRDVDFERDTLTFHDTKNRERRTVAVAGHARELLGEMAGTKVRALSPFVFPSRVDPRQPSTRFPFFHAWHRALAEASLKDLRLHDLRHLAATSFAASGATTVELAAILGHKTLQMVKRYSHLCESDTRSVVARANERLFGGAERSSRG
jgi:integrase